MNPILPLEHYVPDVEGKVFSDGTLYLYGSYDIAAKQEYCSNMYHVFSSKGFDEFTDCGVSFSVDMIPWAESKYLYAPDCIERNRKYYLFFCMSDGSEGVAVSNKPEGPFKNPVPVKGTDKTGIDPTVFADDDGQVYYYWGQFNLRGAKMNDDMCSFDMSTYTDGILTEEEHGFHEGASICKHDGKYYMLYTDTSRGKATCLSYAVSCSPLGPFVKGGVVIDNEGCDPNTWNNHGSLCQIGNDWYVFYHRSTHNSKYSRRVCVEKIEFDGNGHINEVEMTINGQEERVPASRLISASCASCLNGGAYIDHLIVDGEYIERLTCITDGAWAEYKYIDFDNETQCCIEFDRIQNAGCVELHIEKPDGECIGTINVDGNARSCTGNVKGLFGRHALYLVFRGSTGELFDVLRIQFKK